MSLFLSSTVMTGSSASSRKIASNRLQKELVEWQVNPPSGFQHKVTDNLQSHDCQLCLYQHALHAFKFNCEDYGHYLCLQERPEDNDRYVKNCRNGRSPKETRWWFHDDKA